MKTNQKNKMIDAEFHKITLPLERNPFNELFNSVEFESITKGRIGNNLVRLEDNLVPIVRTTTKYKLPAHDFSEIHHTIIDAINNAFAKNNLDDISQRSFNNALIEVYDTDYYKMNFHSDQSLDLDNNSYIGLFSCYENPETVSNQHLRKLKVKNKAKNEELEISLTHNSVVLFSLETNKKFLHKIVLDAKPDLITSDNKWLGITFRKSKTYIQFKNGLPLFSDGKLLELADKEQEKEFYKLRGEENRNIDFVYPNLTYTLSPGDRLLPKKVDKLISSAFLNEIFD